MPMLPVLDVVDVIINYYKYELTSIFNITTSSNIQIQALPIA